MGERAPLLLVEDDPAVVRLMRRILERADWEVTAVPDGGAATIAASQAPPRVAVIDLGVEPDGGVAVARALQAAHADVGFVFVSGTAPVHEDRAWIEAAGGQFLGKPFGPTALLAVVDRAAG